MKTASIVIVGYGVVCAAAGATLGCYLGWTKRGRADQYEIEDADKVCDWAIEERATAINRAAIAEALNLRWDALHFDQELRQLLDNEER